MKDIHLFAVCDGHGQWGRQASLMVKTKLPILFIEYMKFDRNIPNVIKKVGQKLHQELVTSKLLKPELSGTTLNGVIIDFSSGKIHGFNVGDSRCILINNKKEVKPLSFDHKLDTPEEAKRIKSCGGKIGQIKD